MTANDRTTEQGQLDRLKQQMRQAGACPFWGKIPLVLTARDMFNLAVYEIVCDCTGSSDHMADKVAARWKQKWTPIVAGGNAFIREETR